MEKNNKNEKPVTVHITNHNQFQKGVGAFVTNLNHLTIVMDSEGNMKMDAVQTPAMPHTQIEKVKPEKKANFALLVTKPERAAQVIERLHTLMAGHSRPKDILMPIRAAMDAGALKRPTWEEFCVEFGFNLLKSKSSLANYTDLRTIKYDGESYKSMVEEFRKILF